MIYRLYILIIEYFCNLKLPCHVFTVKVRRDAVTWNSAADAVSRKSGGADWALSLTFFWYQRSGF